MNAKRCTLYIGLVLSGLTLAGIVGGMLSAAHAWKEVRELKDALHDENDAKHEQALSPIEAYLAKQIRANETLCAAGKLHKLWCRTQGFEWKTLEEEN